MSGGQLNQIQNVNPRCTSERWATTTMCWLQFHLHTDFTSTRKLRKSFLSMKFYSPHIKDEKINTGGVVTRVPLLTRWFSLVDSHWGFLFHWNIFLLRLFHLAQPLLARFLMKTKVKQRRFRKQIIITVSSSSGRLGTTSTAPRVVIVFLARELGFFFFKSKEESTGACARCKTWVTIWTANLSIVNKKWKDKKIVV